MRRIVRTIALAVALVFCCAALYEKWRNPEHETLTSAARTGAPGKFVGSTRGVTHYDIAGPDTGRVVVLVHGYSVPYYIWDSTFTALSAAGFRTIRYDVFGR